MLFSCFDRRLLGVEESSEIEAACRHGLDEEVGTTGMLVTGKAE